MTESSVTALLSKRYCAPEWAFLAQVRNGTGSSRRVTRTADGIAMSLWPSRGLHLHGFEIKVSRSDFRHEMKQPEKAEDIARFCHFWWIVAPATVAPLEELPTNWGLLAVDGDTLKIAKQAVYREAQEPDFPILASIFRNVHESLGDMVPKGELDTWKKNMESSVRAAEAALYQRNLDYALERGKAREALLAKVETVLGCRLSEWNCETSLNAIKLAQKLSGQSSVLIRSLENLIGSLDKMKPAIAEAKAELEMIEL